MIYAIGDIHGHLQKLEGLLDSLSVADRDRLVFIGDYIDRGPNSSGVIELLIQLKEAKPDTVFLRGNHEQMLLDARTAKESGIFSDSEDIAIWLGNGGADTIDSYPGPRGRWVEKIPEEHWAFVESTLLEYDLEPFIFVHAGLAPPDGYTDLPPGIDPRLWIREPFIHSRADFGGRVIFGHTPQRTGRPLVMANKIGIDTAAAFGGPLTGLALDRERPDWFQIFQCD